MAASARRSGVTGLTTHVLDLTHGRPGAGVGVALMFGAETLFEGQTDADGRCPGLAAIILEVGLYRLEFAVADYFRSQGVALADPPFLDWVGIDFGVSDPLSHHHVPLLVSPFGYSTYRGS